MNCYCCGHTLRWENDFTCQDVYFCECEQGIISFYSCDNCDAHYQIEKGCTTY